MYSVTPPIQPRDMAYLLETTKSLCPDCFNVIDAKIVVDKGAVYMEKYCPGHGGFRHYLWPDADHYVWQKSFKFDSVLPIHPRPIEKGCPRNCGLCLAHLKHPRLVELELTRRCNLHCPLCFMSADGGREDMPPDPGMQEIKQQLNRIMEQAGAQTSIQLTGGEPTIREDLPEIVNLCRKAGFSAIEVNTNGLQIGRRPDYINQLASAGITGVYLQFDGLTNDVYRKIRGADLLGMKLQAIEYCRATGIQVVLSMAVVREINDNQMGDLLQYALKNIDVIAGIAFQPAFTSGRNELSGEFPITMGDVIFQLAEQSHGMIRPYDFWPTGCSHPLCDATTYIVRQAGQHYKSIGQLIDAEHYRRHHRHDSPQGSALPDLADQLCPDMEKPGLSILIMNYMSVHDVDLNRLQQCSMTVAGPGGRLIPFCAYQLTNTNDQKLYDFNT